MSLDKHVLVACSYLNTNSYLICCTYSCHVISPFLVCSRGATQCNLLVLRKDALFSVAYESGPNLSAVVLGSIQTLGYLLPEFCPESSGQKNPALMPRVRQCTHLWTSLAASARVDMDFLWSTHPVHARCPIMRWDVR